MLIQLFDHFVLFHNSNKKNSEIINLCAVLLPGSIQVDINFWGIKIIRNLQYSFCLCVNVYKVLVLCA